MKRIHPDSKFIGLLCGLTLVVGCAPNSATLDAASPDSGSAAEAGLLDAGLPDAARPDARVEGDAGVDATTPRRCALPAAFDVGVQYARELRVDSARTGGDGSRANPFGSLAEAARAATPGTRIVLAAGTYRGSVYLENLMGTATQPIAIVGEGQVILDGGGAAEVLHLSEVAYVVLEHLTLMGANTNGLNIDDGGTADTPAHHVVLRDLEVRDIGTGGNNDCIKLSGLDDFFILETRAVRCNAGDAIDHVGCHRGLIHGCSFADCAGGGIQMKGGSSDILVHGNRFSDIAERSINAGGSTGLEFFRPIDAPHEAARLRIEANIFTRSGAGAVAFVGCDACVFSNNDVFAPQGWVARILQETVAPRFVPSRNGLFVNNIVVFARGELRAFVNVGPDTAPQTFTFANNLWYATDDPSFTGPVLTDGIPAETGAVIQPYRGVSESGDLCLGDPGYRGGRPVSGSTRDIRGACWDGEMPSIGAVQAYSCTL